MTPDQWADSDEWPLPTYSGSSKVAATFYDPQAGTQDARKGRGEGSGEIERLRAVNRVRAYLVARDGFYGREAGDEDLLDMAPSDESGAPTLLLSDLRTLVDAPGPEMYDDRTDAYYEPTPPAAPQAEDGAPEWWDADHSRPADAYTSPERQFCKRCGFGRLAHDANFVTGDIMCRPAPVADPSGTGETR